MVATALSSMVQWWQDPHFCLIPDADYPLDFLHRLSSTVKDYERCDDNSPPSEQLFENSLTVHNSIHVSGNINVSKRWGSQVGVSKQPKVNVVKSKSFLLANVGETFYD